MTTATRRGCPPERLRRDSARRATRCAGGAARARSPERARRGRCRDAASPASSAATPWRRRAGAGRPGPRDRPCCGRRARPGTRRSRGGSRRSSRRPDRRRARSIRAAGRSSSCRPDPRSVPRDPSPTRASPRRCTARRGAAGSEPGREPARDPPSRSDRAPCWDRSGRSRRSSSQKSRRLAARPIRISGGRSARNHHASANHSDVNAKRTAR